MKIAQIPSKSANSSQALRALAVAEFGIAFLLAQHAEFYQVVGNADSPRKVDGVITAGDTRTIGSDYTAKSNTPGFGAVALKIYGDKVKTDKAYERRGFDIGSQRSSDLANFSASLGRYFMDALFNHELSDEHFSGLKEQATALSRKVNFIGENGGAVVAGTSDSVRLQQSKFLEFLDSNIEDIAGGPDVIVMNGAWKARLKSVGRDYITTQVEKDIYGANRTIESYNGIPIINAGFAANNTGLILPNDETEGTSTSACSSMYLIKFGEKSDVTLATNSGLDVEDMGVVGTEYLTMVEFDIDLAILNAKSFKRLAGLKLVA